MPPATARVGALVSAFALAACAGRPRPAIVARNVVLVTIDTLRADRLGCYGSRDVATPRLDRIASEGNLAPEASVHVPLTRPSHTSILTGLLPAEHGIRDNVSPSLDAGVPSLPQILAGAGFETAGFVSSIVLSAQSGLNRGFGTYSDKFEVSGDDARFLNSIQRRGDGPTAEAIAWLDAHRASRSFVWLHLYDPHDPYEPPEPYASRYADRPYDGEVAWTDELIGRLDDALTRFGRRDDTLLVITSDHGEGLGEHEESVHGFFLYQTTLHVPLLVRGPGIVAGGRLAVTARSIDLVPTILELAGVPAPQGVRLSGRSLAGAMRGQGGLLEAPAYAEALLPLLHYGWSDLRMLRDGRYKYIQAPRPELYDLARDPHEQHDLAAQESARADAMRNALAAILAKEKASAQSPASAAGVPPELLEKLGALGYLGAGGTSAGASAGADPKDKIGEFKVLNRLVREGLIKLREKDYAGSAERLQELRRRGVESFEVHYYLARALVGLGRQREAIPEFQGAIDRLPAFGAAYLGLADCRIAIGELAAALTALQQGVAAAPKDVGLREREAQVLRKLKRQQEAAAAYEAAIALAPKDALLKVQLGETRRDLGDLAGAVTALREAVAIEAANASYWNALGMVLGMQEDMPEAEKAFREAAEKDDANAEYAYNLGLALLRQGRMEAAASAFRKAATLNPAFPAPRQRLAEMGRR